VSPVSPLAPDAFPVLPAVDGVRLRTYAGGLGYDGRPDLLLAELLPGTTVAGVFTSSMCPSAPVEWCRRILPAGGARAIVCNAGNANAFTGRAGASATEFTARSIGASLDADADQVYVASTGVIGEPLDEAALAVALPALAAAGPATWAEAADAIRTTDTFAKGAGAVLPGGGVVAGIAKGSGMIAPDMATMLGFVFTDVAVAPAALQQALVSAVDASFNRITVDSDTSTSDTVLAFATGVAANPRIEGPESAGWEELNVALSAVCLDLAHQIVRDGEGATKFVEVTVTGAEDEAAAKAIAFAIANSPLVKTALAASDANWGRIIMAVGKAGQRADRDRLAISIGDERVTEHGMMLDSYSEDRATEHLRGDEVSIRVDVGVGNGAATVWTCDLTHGYIEINAGYRS